VESFNKPPATMTGVTFYNVALIGKRLGLLHELLPRDARIAILSNPMSPSRRPQIAAAQSSAQALGRQIELFEAQTPEELDRAFASMVARRVGGLLHATDPFFNSHRRQLVELAMRNRLPSVFSGREYLEFGAAAAYGASIPDAIQQAGSYAGRILKGEKPGNLPVVQSARFQLILNLKAAKALGITFSSTMLALADDVIE
jgi:putative tryptophan/tyrosine transport system substrate-binding protein